MKDNKNIIIIITTITIPIEIMTKIMNNTVYKILLHFSLSKKKYQFLLEKTKVCAAR